MFATPVQILSLWTSGLISLAAIAGGAYALREWYRRSWVLVQDLDRQVQYWAFDPDWGANLPTALFLAGLALLVWSLLGGLIARLVRGLIHGSGGAPDHPGHQPFGPERRLRRADGTELNIATHGPESAPTLILTHGWGANSTEWNYLKRDLGDRFRLIAWDLPGLGKSTRPPNLDYSLENLAAMLDDVVSLAGADPVVLVGHSIGGMITLTYAQCFPDALGPRVAGLALVETTYTNPVRTTKNAPIYTALERPLIVPLLRLTIAFWPIAWAMNGLSYLRGSAHRSTRRSGFAGTQRPGQVEFMTRFQVHAPPDVIARGMFGMLAYDATTALPTIGVPTLIVPGDRDPVCLPEASERMDREIPRSRLAPLAPGKHMALIEHHESIASLLTEFADGCLAPAATAGQPHRGSGTVG